MAEDVVRARGWCQWNPDHGRRSDHRLIYHGVARFRVVYEGSSLELCEDCATLDRFKSLKKERIPYRTGHTCDTPGIYRSQCSCAVEAAVTAGESFPHCRRCLSFVDWELVRTVT
jgi:hypothetical protein